MLTDNKQQHFGIIKFYNTEKGFGMIQNHEFGDVRLRLYNRT
jgi:cold shock CspA family protein